MSHDAAWWTNAILLAAILGAVLVGAIRAAVSMSRRRRRERAEGLAAAEQRHPAGRSERVRLVGHPERVRPIDDREAAVLDPYAGELVDRNIARLLADLDGRARS